MGGDRGPEVVLRGAVAAADRDPEGLRLLLVGDRDVLEGILERRKWRRPNLEVVHASEAIEMDESPATAIRRKKDASIVVACRLISSGEAEALVSAGNTGAVVASALLHMGRLRGVSRPAIATFMPNQKRGTVVLDVGANAECTPKNLVQFALMGAVYAEYQLEVPEPRVGLLNIGEESSKGNKLVREAYRLLERSGVNFVGNVEGRDVFGDRVDVVVCDGFVGNVVLKFSESIIFFMTHLLRQEIKRSTLGRIGAMLMRRSFSAMRQRLDYAEYGGAPLLGVKGGVIIAHGKSSHRAIQNAIAVAKRFVSVDINRRIEDRFEGTVNDIAQVS
jgi:glycerol-3-phosphate acyltransferase PlsX